MKLKFYPLIKCIYLSLRHAIGAGLLLRLSWCWDSCRGFLKSCISIKAYIETSSLSLDTNKFTGVGLYSVLPIITLPTDYSNFSYLLSFNFAALLVHCMHIYFIFTFVAFIYLFYVFFRYTENKIYIGYLIIASIIFYFLPITMLVLSLIGSTPMLLVYYSFYFQKNNLNLITSFFKFYLNLVLLMSSLIYIRLYFIPYLTFIFIEWLIIF